MEIDRLPPHSIEAEEAVLGSLIIDPDVIHDVDSDGLGIPDRLTPEMFYRETSRWVYRAILDLHEQKTPIDLITLTDRLRANGQLEELGGESYVIGLVNVVPTSINALHYAKIVQTMAIRREMVYAAARIASLAYDETVTAEEVKEQAETIMLDLGRMDVSASTMKSPKQLAHDYLKKIESPIAKLIRTGFHDLDDIISSLEEGLHVIGARTGMGKTTAALSMAWNMSEAGHRVGFFSIEMPAYQLVERFISSMTGIPTQALRKVRLGQIQLSPEQTSHLYDAIGRFSESGITVDDIPRCTPANIRTKLIRAQKSGQSFDVVFIDFLQLMGLAQGGKEKNRNLEVGEITRELKVLSHELHIPIIILSQLSRSIESRQDKRPQLSDLRDSGEIEQNADAVWGLYNDSYYHPESAEATDDVEIIPLKDRLYGSGQRVTHVYHDKKHGRLINYEKRKRPRPS